MENFALMVYFLSLNDNFNGMAAISSIAKLSHTVLN